MKILLLLAIIVAFGLLQAHGAFWDFQTMVRKVTGKNVLSNYSFYGCYCGYGGRGTPKDATDRCCFQRDCCYRRLKKEGCRTRHLHYSFDYKDGQITCDSKDSCRKKLCECDKAAALCFKENWSSYNKTYKYFSRLWCQGQAPQC